MIDDDKHMKQNWSGRMKRLGVTKVVKLSDLNTAIGDEHVRINK